MNLHGSFATISLILSLSILIALEMSHMGSTQVDHMLYVRLQGRSLTHQKQVSCMNISMN